MIGSEPDICRQILAERRVGHTRCGIVHGDVTCADVARSFGLSDEAEIYRPVDRSEAASIAIGILSRDLAYDTEIMSPARAEALWGQFLQLFDGQKVRLFSNCRSGLHQWNPATKSTFDIGILIVGEVSGGCLWVEDED
ncbi:hypothetical protein NLM31_22475 [Bradyrhizobium sp. CCGUVB4N]|uniref:hypothetical protein n=1 Tax=Bradyrhizobium sp. CCGUVB4N TaxID=2949631 RepID=UPI0020B2CA49|nr:hypothetical protein [Bradyrhizobium sp. CCGUVB4N]MCP3383136.1 hypothetical protein [Bradyrhizobium sp. CCGUVB4N]